MTFLFNNMHVCKRMNSNIIIILIKLSFLIKLSTWQIPNYKIFFLYQVSLYWKLMGGGEGENSLHYFILAENSQGGNGLGENCHGEELVWERTICHSYSEALKTIFSSVFKCLPVKSLEDRCNTAFVWVVIYNISCNSPLHFLNFICQCFCHGCQTV